MKFYKFKSFKSATVFVTALAVLAQDVQGHALMYNPPTRNFLAFQFGAGGGDIDGYCPHCLNKDPFRDNWGGCGSTAASGGGVQSKGIVQGTYTYDSWNGFALGTTPWKTSEVIVDNTYQAGQTIPIKVKVNAYHAGLFQLWLYTDPAAYDGADIALDNGNAAPYRETTTLRRRMVHCVGDGKLPEGLSEGLSAKCCYYRKDGLLLNESAPHHTKCRGGLTYQEFQDGGHDEAGFYSMWWLPGRAGLAGTYTGSVSGGVVTETETGLYEFPARIPDTSCEGVDRDGNARCVLQWWYLSNNSCIGWTIPNTETHIINPTMEEGVDYNGWETCAVTHESRGDGRGEQFFNCADIRIEGGAAPVAPSPLPTRTPTDPAMPTDPPTVPENPEAAHEDCENRTYVETCDCHGNSVTGPCDVTACIEGFEVSEGGCLLSSLMTSAAALNECLGRPHARACGCEHDDIGPCVVLKCAQGFRTNVPKSKCKPKPTAKPTAPDSDSESDKGDEGTASTCSLDLGNNAGTQPGKAGLFRKLAEEDTEAAFGCKVLVSINPQSQEYASNVYKYPDLREALRVMTEQGIAGNYFWTGDDGDDMALAEKYALVNLAAFLAQSMKETIMYDVCDENNWSRSQDYPAGQLSHDYPANAACGQLNQDYGSYHCTEQDNAAANECDGGGLMECQVDLEMALSAYTSAAWWGAPGPLACGPPSDEAGPLKDGAWWNHNTDSYDTTFDASAANSSGHCSAPGYLSQKACANDGHSWKVGKTNVEGCCWWGRGVIQTTGVCNFGKFNFYAGKRAADRGVNTPYSDIDFCRRPDAICDPESPHQELKWIAGMFYWAESVQGYQNWDYQQSIKTYVANPTSTNLVSLIDAVSGIVNRGCHNPPCATGAVHGNSERRENFKAALAALGMTDGHQQTKVTSCSLGSSPVTAPTNPPTDPTWSGPCHSLKPGQASDEWCVQNSCQPADWCAAGEGGGVDVPTKAPTPKAPTPGSSTGGCAVCVHKKDTCNADGLKPAKWVTFETTTCRDFDGDANGGCAPDEYWNRCKCVDEASWTHNTNADTGECEPREEADPVLEQFTCFPGYKAKGRSLGNSFQSTLEDCLDACREFDGKCQGIQFNGGKFKLRNRKKNCQLRGPTKIKKGSKKGKKVPASVKKAKIKNNTSCLKAHLVD